MKLPIEVKKKLLEELMAMMDDMSSEGLPKKGSVMISMEGDKDEENPMDMAEEGEDAEMDMEGMDPRLMELLKKKKGAMSGMMKGF